MRVPCRIALLSLLASPAAAHDLLVCEITTETVMRFSGQDGSLVDPVFIDLRQGTGTAPDGPTEVVVVGEELWIVDISAGAIHVWSRDGETYLGEHQVGCGDPAGAAVAGGSVWVTNRGSGPHGEALKSVDAQGVLLDVHPANDPWDVMDFDGTLLVGNTGTDNIERYAYDGTFLGIFFAGSQAGLVYPEQITRRASNGNLLVAGYQSQKVHEIDAAGNKVKNINPAIGGLRGAWELGNGNLLLSGSNGVYVWDVPSKTATAVVTGVSAASITDYREGGPIGTPFCGPSNLNSIGKSAVVIAFGDEVVSSNYVEVTASRMPPNQFGYFLVSEDQGFVPFPGGSQGNLCLSGAIGRYKAQIGNTGGAGTLTLAVDLTAVPIATGFTQVVAGESWHWQCWYRDVNPGPTSNFTNAVCITFE